MFARTVNSLVKGAILIWSGAVVDIPVGWHLCNGDEGTPDLRGRFVVGVEPPLSPGSTGGSGIHTHAFTGDYHQHMMVGGVGLQDGGGYSAQTTGIIAGGTNANSDNRPPYYAISYIMKL